MLIKSRPALKPGRLAISDQIQNLSIRWFKHLSGQNACFLQQRFSALVAPTRQPVPKTFIGKPEPAKVRHQLRSISCDSEPKLEHPSSKACYQCRPLQNFHALRNVSLNVHRGQRVALLGKSGSGKSTLLNVIGGLDMPSAGKILVNGRDLARLSSNELARHRLEAVGMIFQSFNLIPSGTAMQNVELPMIFAGRTPYDRRAAARSALEEVGLGNRLKHRPGELSGGRASTRGHCQGAGEPPHDPPGGRAHWKPGSGIGPLFERGALGPRLRPPVGNPECGPLRNLAAAARINQKESSKTLQLLSEDGIVLTHVYDLHGNTLTLWHDPPRE
jgi:hypothetical protein